MFQYTIRRNKLQIVVVKMENSKLLVFVPMYNCEKQIVRVIQQFKEVESGLVDTILICNNQSTDSSQQKAQEKLSELKNIKTVLLYNRQNYGLGGSHKVAFQYAIDRNFSHIVVLHGDDQGHFNDIIPLLKKGEHHNYDCLLGARFHPSSVLKGYSRVRTWGNIAFNFLFSIVLSARVYDLGAGLNLYKIDTLNNKYFIRFPDDLTFNYIMIMAHLHYKHKIKFFPISWREDDQVSNVKLFSQGKRVLKMLLSFFFKRETFLKSDHRLVPFDSYEGIRQKVLSTR